jgi:tripartite-type tricarboxylate transporter receptor subunit TctC
VCAVRTDSGINSLKDLVAAMKKNPASSTSRPPAWAACRSWAWNLLKVKTDTYAVHIPYASSPLAIMAILQGDVQFACVPAWR